MRGVATVCCLLLAVTVCTVQAANKSLMSNERLLYHQLTDNLVASVRPVAHSNDTVNVKMGLTLVRIHDLDEKTQKLDTNVWLSMEWTDAQLKWDPNDYDGLKKIRVPSRQVWTPDIVLFNMAHGEQYNSNVDWLNVVVDNTGKVVYVPHLRLESVCLLDMSRFPYDSHNCSLKLGSWTYHRSLVNISFQYDLARTELSFFSPHSEWSLVGNHAQLNNVKYDCCAETYQDITFSVKLKRNNAYYTHVFVAPSVILLFITPTIFWLPPDSHEKMTLGTGVMLGHVLLLVMLENYIPAAHPSVPIIGQYYIFGLVMVGLALVLAVMVKNVWSQSNRRKAVPGFLRTVVLGLLGRLLCVRRDTYTPVNDQQDTDSYENRTAATAKVAAIQATSEWRQLAAILDRLCFILFLIISFIMTVVMLHY